MHKFAGLLARTEEAPVIHCLDVYSPGRRPYTIPLVDMCTRVGTGPGADLQLDDPLLDQVHCQILYHEETYLALAAGRHHLVVNNIAMRQRQLRPNDRIRIGTNRVGLPGAQADFEAAALQRARTADISCADAAGSKRAGDSAGSLARCIRDADPGRACLSGVVCARPAADSSGTKRLSRHARQFGVAVFRFDCANYCAIAPTALDPGFARVEPQHGRERGAARSPLGVVHCAARSRAHDGCALCGHSLGFQRRSRNASVRHRSWPRWRCCG